MHLIQYTSSLYHALLLYTTHMVIIPVTLFVLVFTFWCRDDQTTETAFFLKNSFIFSLFHTSDGLFDSQSAFTASLQSRLTGDNEANVQFLVITSYIPDLLYAWLHVYVTLLYSTVAYTHKTLNFFYVEWEALFRQLREGGGCP